jgi:hypothetical protein
MRFEDPEIAARIKRNSEEIFLRRRPVFVGLLTKLEKVN